jgi:hypothetical protein
LQEGNSHPLYSAWALQRQLMWHLLHFVNMIPIGQEHSDSLPTLLLQ